jgi:hypothetical protein
VYLDKRVAFGDCGEQKADHNSVMAEFRTGWKEAPPDHPAHWDLKLLNTILAPIKRDAA